MRLREAARAVVLDPSGRILLVRFDVRPRALWACPGGGLESSESHEEAIRRELLEEVGLNLESLGPCIWTRTHVIPFGGFDGQVERFFLVHADAFDPRGTLSPDELRAEHVTAVRWWTPEELARSTELHAPRRLPQLVADLWAEGPPPEPIDVGV